MVFSFPLQTKFGLDQFQSQHWFCVLWLPIILALYSFCLSSLAKKDILNEGFKKIIIYGLLISTFRPMILYYWRELSVYF
jgi:hypothetical protein